MSKKKRLLSIVLSVVMVATFMPWSGITASAGYTGSLQFDANGKFTVLQLADIQDNASVDSRVINLITNLIARYDPDLVVFTGDNISGSISSSAFQSSVNAFTQPLVNTNTPFAVTFGNHDAESIPLFGDPGSKDTQYNYYMTKSTAIDHDVDALTGTGSGVIPIYPNGQTTGTPAFQIYLMDSGMYDSNDDYDCPYTDQIDYYIQRSLLYPNVPSLWYMHIIVPDVTTEVMSGGNLIPERINWEKSGFGTTLSEIFKEAPCPATWTTYNSTAHRSSATYGSKTLYESWVAYGNMLGTYYGHDHKNSFVSTTDDGIDIGYGKAPTLNSYNDGNPGSRIYQLDIDGTYSTYNVTESDLLKAQIFFDANGGKGEMIPQLITKSTTAALKANTYTKTGTSFLGWATSPTGNVAYSNGANYAIGTSDVTLYAKWGVTSDITFNANGGNGGTGPSAMVVGTTLAAPNVTRTGYTLAGWSPALPSTVPSSSTTYTAQWTANNYTVNYNANGSTAGSTASSSHTYNTAKNLTSNGYSRVGHSFLGWSTSSSATTATYTNSQSVINLTSTPNGVLTFYAVWQINSYLMTFDANGGSGGTSSSKTYGTTFTAPTVTRAGYTFSSWLPAVPATVPGYNETFVAQWTQNSYTITFNANGGNGGTSSSVLYGVLPSAPTVTKTGYSFAGWSPAIVAATASATYTAQWNTNNYNIFFNADGGTGSTGGAMTYGTPLSAPAVTKPGYTFVGWSPSVPSTVPAGDTTYKALWNPINFNITFNANGGTGGTSGLMAYGSELTPPSVTRVGYAFMGWTPEVPLTVPATDSTYTAQWAISTNNLTLFANGGTGGTSVMLDFGDPIIPPTISRPGYIFTGWYPVLPSTVVGGINTYDAQWIVNSYLVTFDANGGSGSTSGLLQFGTHLTIPTILKPGFTFTGWSPDVPATVQNENVTYTAQWSRNKIQITFDANGGVGGTSNLMTFADSLIPPVVSRPGYIFTGWYPAVPTKVVSGNQTYTAQWMAVS